MLGAAVVLIVKLGSVCMAHSLGKIGVKANLDDIVVPRLLWIDSLPFHLLYLESVLQLLFVVTQVVGLHLNGVLVPELRVLLGHLAYLLHSLN
mmetsp:Transcript_40050/g.38586  ORF Transcript_40050/g.38586 Transcript_40050/m.38586 type:complete len:93 (-) Transcript_40050:498-776(-)